MHRDSEVTQFTAATSRLLREVHTEREPIKFVVVIQVINQYKQDLTLLQCDTMLLGEWFLTFQWPIYLEPVEQSILDCMTPENEDTSKPLIKYSVTSQKNQIPFGSGHHPSKKCGTKTEGNVPITNMEHY